MSRHHILLLLGVISFILGPLTSIPGIVIGWKTKPRSRLSNMGYYLCWISLFLTFILVIFLLLFARQTGKSDIYFYDLLLPLAP